MMKERNTRLRHRIIGCLTALVAAIFVVTALVGDKPSTGNTTRGPSFLEEVPLVIGTKEYDISQMYDVCVPKRHGEKSSTAGAFDEGRFASWLRDPRSGLEKIDDDDDFIDCATLHFQESQRASNNIRKGSDPKRPKAIIHVGPRKTGSTAIQDAMLEKYSEELLDENYLFIAKDHHAFTHCLTLYEIPEEWTEMCDNMSRTLDHMKDTITTARVEDKNILISSESFDQVYNVNTTRIKHLFAGFDIHIVVTYRRYFEWIVSKFGQDYRHSRDWNHWKQGMKEKNKNVVSSLSAEYLKKTYTKFSTLEVYRMYRQAGFATHMLNFHADNNVVKSFFCLDILKTPSICRLESQTESKKANKAETIAYDEIAVAVKEAGLLNGMNLTRPEVRGYMQSYFEEARGETASDLPRICMQQRELNLLENISIMSESLSVPRYYNAEGKHSFSTHFEEYKKTRFCAVDTEKVLNAHNVSIRSVLLLNNH